MSLTLIETKTSTGSISVFDFINIPNRFTDLMLVISARQATGTNAIGRLTFNGVTTNLTSRALAGGGSSALSISGSQPEPVLSQATDTANTFGSISTYIPNYASTSMVKSFSINSVSENNATSAYQRLTAGLWNNTAAINQISFTSPDGNWANGSTASLYGIKADTTITQPKAIGGTTITSGGYVYHVFRESGTFVALQSLNADVLMIGGGGGGGFSYGLGGGAGTVAATYNQTLSGAKTVVVGYGGGPGYYNNGNGGNGYNGGATTFTGLPTAAGGAGGPQGGWNGGNGAGSGPSGQNGGAGTYGFVSWATATGTGYDNGFYGGGGGGGGYESYGMGGIGGGGNGGAYAFGMYGGNNGVYNTGSGGGGGYSGSGAGGSGLVIVRYLI